MSDEERFNYAIEALLADRSPAAQTENLDEDELAMLRMAQMLRGSRQQAPDPQFVERLHDRLFPRSRRISRRTAFLSGMGALAAGVAAGLGIDRMVENQDTNKPVAGRWIQVANVADVPEGAVRPFTAGALHGFLLRKGDRFRAMSSICTHLQCGLHFSRNDQSFVCPCHGAEFDLNGQVLSGPGGYYQDQIPPLPKFEVRVNGDAVEVFGA